MDVQPHMIAHRLWKSRLAAYVADPAAAPLDEKAVGRDDLCEFGRWIHGEGRKHGGAQAFEEVRRRHAQFHEQAAAVVARVKAGDRSGAEDLMKPLGPFDAASAAVQTALVRLRDEVA